MIRCIGDGGVEWQGIVEGERRRVGWFFEKFKNSCFKTRTNAVKSYVLLYKFVICQIDNIPKRR